jgi:hypothetical protein
MGYVHYALEFTLISRPIAAYSKMTHYGLGVLAATFF